MVKRVKRVEKGIESLKQEIETHFAKIEEDISEKNIDRGRYHLKEIEKSLLKALEIKIDILGEDNSSVLAYRERIENLRKLIGSDE